MGTLRHDPALREGIIRSANALGMSPRTLAAIMSYETAGTLNPTKRGPTTQWGQHRGLIQWGEPQAKKYGVDWNDPIGSQLGPNGAVVKYFEDAGWKPGMSDTQAYAAVNAGDVRKVNASDANNGGASGTVADKVRGQFASHYKNADKLLGSAGDDRLDSEEAELDRQIAALQGGHDSEEAELDRQIAALQGKQANAAQPSALDALAEYRARQTQAPEPASSAGTATDALTEYRRRTVSQPANGTHADENATLRAEKEAIESSGPTGEKPAPLTAEDRAKMRSNLNPLSSFTEGAENKVRQQGVGIRQMYGELTGAERDAELDAEGQRLKERELELGMPGQLGSVVVSGAEMAALPTGGLGTAATKLVAGPTAKILAGAAGRAIGDAGVGAAYGALDPALSGEQRASNAASSAAVNATVPAALSGILGIGGKVAVKTKDLIARDAAAAKEINRRIMEGKVSVAELEQIKEAVRRAEGPATPRNVFGQTVEGPPAPGRYRDIPGVEPTLAMTAPHSPFAAQVERQGRLTNKDAFMARDTENLKAGYRALENAAERPEVTTARRRALGKGLEPLQKEAFDTARDKLATEQTDALSLKIGESPEFRLNTGAQSVRRILDTRGNASPLHPEDLKVLRDEIKKKLQSPALGDAETTALKQEYRLAAQAQEALDADLNAASGGKWGDWLTQYREGARPIESKEGLEAIRDALKLNETIAPTGERAFTGRQIRSAAERETFGDFGSKKHMDLMTPEDRALVEQLDRLGSDIGHARSPGNALSGSQTTPLAIEFARRADMPKPVRAALGLWDVLKKGPAEDTLAGSALTPRKFVDLLEKAGKLQGKEGSMLEKLLGAAKEKAGQAGRAAPVAIQSHDRRQE